MTNRKYGCWNRAPFATHYAVGVRPVLVDGVVQEIPVLQVNTGSQDCHYTHTTLGQSDVGCTNCIHRVSK